MDQHHPLSEEPQQPPPTHPLEPVQATAPSPTVPLEPPVDAHEAEVSEPAAALPTPTSMADRMPPPRRSAERPARSTDAPAPAAEAESSDESAGPRKRFEGKQGKQAERRVQSGKGSPRHLVEGWLAEMCKTGGSDLILRASGRPSLRVDGKIIFLPGRVPGPGPLEEVLVALLGERRMKTWRSTGSADSALQMDGLGRFRINAYRQMGEPALVIRRVNEVAPKLESLRLPTAEIHQLCARKRGLILVTGVAGSGKSTSLGGMIQHMNENYERHIITLEDPVELMYTEERCVISQREIGTDTPTFGDGLRHALRQSPDVIMIGEIRDAETVVAALEATETGHTVMSTMHTVNAAQTVDRILGFFPAERHTQVRQRMADNLAGVLSQRLVPAIGGGQFPAYELMMSTPQVRELLNEGRTTEIAKVIETASEAGLISFNECLRGMVESRTIELEDALATSDRPDELLLALRGFRSSSEKVSRPDVGPGVQPQAPAGASPAPGQASSTVTPPTLGLPKQPPEAGGDGLRMAR
ncbi:MAG: pilus retraction protein PilT [Planctomycetota bacterium]